MVSIFEPNFMAIHQISLKAKIVNLMVALEEGDHIRMDPLGSVDICEKFCSNPSYSY